MRNDEGLAIISEHCHDSVQSRLNCRTARPARFTGSYGEPCVRSVCLVPEKQRLIHKVNRAGTGWC